MNARAVIIAKIATCEIEDVTTDEGKNAAAVALGQLRFVGADENLGGLFFKSSLVFLKVLCRSLPLRCMARSSCFRCYRSHQCR